MAQHTNKRPVFLDLARIRMPVGSITSITHRVTGVLLALGTPILVCLLGLSLQDEQGYARVVALFGSMPLRLVSIVFIWAFAHHLLAGVRHLLGDIDIGARLPVARKSAWFVNCGALVVALLYAGMLL
jgi:succinate dehydrogenase / fumarate reductase cytochrome b subunit